MRLSVSRYTCRLNSRTGFNTETFGRTIGPTIVRAVSQRPPADGSPRAPLMQPLPLGHRLVLHEVLGLDLLHVGAGYLAWRVSGAERTVPDQLLTPTGFADPMARRPLADACMRRLIVPMSRQPAQRCPAVCCALQRQWRARHRVSGAKSLAINEPRGRCSTDRTTPSTTLKTYTCSDSCRARIAFRQLSPGLSERSTRFRTNVVAVSYGVRAKKSTAVGWRSTTRQRAGRPADSVRRSEQ